MLSASSAASFVTSPSTPGCDYGNSSRLLSDMLVFGIGSLRVVTGKKIEHLINAFFQWQ